MIAFGACCWFAIAAAAQLPEGNVELPPAHEAPAVIWDENTPPYDRRFACGAFCLTFLAKLQGVDCELSEVVADCSPPAASASLGQLRDQAQRMGLSAEGFACPADQLDRLEQPAILHFSAEDGTGHFVAFVRYDADSAKFLIYDPATGLHNLQQEALADRYTGKLLVVTSQPAVEVFRPPHSVWWDWLLGGLLGAQVLVLARGVWSTANRRREMASP